MIELGRGAVNMVHKVVGTGSSYLAPLTPLPQTYWTLCSVADFKKLTRSLYRL